MNHQESRATEQDRINSLIYCDLTRQPPSRYEMVKYSTWRIFLYNELEGEHFDRRDEKKLSENYCSRFKSLSVSEERKRFYNFVFVPSGDNRQDYRIDNISHFICRMLYCQEETTHHSFVAIEKRILEERLLRMLGERTISKKKEVMALLKKLLAIFKGKQSEAYDISADQWDRLKDKITFSAFKSQNESSSLYARLPFKEADLGIRRRRSYVERGEVFANTDIMVDIVVSNYEKYLHQKLDKTRPIVTELLTQDTDNQFSSFLTTTIRQINEEGMQDAQFNGKFNLTLRNVDMVSNKFFPPCMLNLNSHLKTNRHLKHDGRRQLWGFFKACGMDVHDNKEYFRRYFEGKVTASEMKTHMYNIEHIYGLQGKRKVEQAWVCRNIISGTAPKKGEHHGCPFSHWRSEDLKDYLKKNYRVSDDHLNEIMAKKEEKLFQVACGRLFEYSEANQTKNTIPAEITGKLGRAPHLYYEAAMELREIKQKANGKDDANTSIDF